MTWDYDGEKKKHPCVVCGGEVAVVGMTLPLCNSCEVIWIASDERTQRATARWRFVNRVRGARSLPPIPYPGDGTKRTTPPVSDPSAKVGP